MRPVVASALSSALLVVACSPHPSPPDTPTTNQALRFRAASAQYATSGTADFPNGVASQTIAFWMRVNPDDAGTNGEETLVTLRRDVTSGVVFGLRGGGLAAWNVYGDDILVQTSSLPSLGVWHYLAYVFEQGDARAGTSTIYVDGRSVASAISAPNYLTPYEAWYGSLDGTREFFNGDLDEIRIWRVARSRDDLAEDMTSSVDAGENELVAYFTCDAVHDGVVADMSGWGNDMTLGGGVVAQMPELVASTVP